MASFNASLTVISFVPLGVAYCLRAIDGVAAVGRSTVRGARVGLEAESRRLAGRRRREADMATGAKGGRDTERRRIGGLVELDEAVDLR